MSPRRIDGLAQESEQARAVVRVGADVWGRLVRQHMRGRPRQRQGTMFVKVEAIGSLEIDTARLGGSDVLARL